MILVAGKVRQCRQSVFGDIASAGMLRLVEVEIPVVPKPAQVQSNALFKSA